MKNILYKTSLTGLITVIFLMTACEPQMKDKPDIGLPPTADQLNFAITPGSDEFHVIITNTSTVTGIPSWDFGNGMKGTGPSNEIKYSLEGDYDITMTYLTKGGMGSIKKTYTQPVTDFSIFTDPVYVNLTGGAEDADGKTWVLDVETTGHIGVGPSDPPGTGMEWWACPPNGKSGTGLMDDEITFVLNEFVVTYNSNGVSYVKGYRANDPALASIYLNPRVNNGDYDVDYATPTTGTWMIVEKSGADWIVLNGAKPIFPCFDVGAKNNEYKIVKVEENLLELVCYSSYEAWTLWHYYLIPKGYVRPSITFTVNATEGVDNDVACSVTGYSIPAGQSVTNIVWNFGDGSTEVTGGKDEVIHHTFMRKGPYTVTAKLNTSIGTLTGTKSITLANHNSAYVEYLLNLIIVYNNFSDVQIYPVLGENCGVTIVDNPLKEVPNRSSKVASYTKTNNEWAN
ncbi:MAG: PKD domain-containing protein, partial [Bacteroidales bacterium]|nr:PKD domain-containing protein [Bacteroidales bacterium]